MNIKLSYWFRALFLTHAPRAKSRGDALSSASLGEHRSALFIQSYRDVAPMELCSMETPAGSNKPRNENPTYIHDPEWVKCSSGSTSSLSLLDLALRAVDCNRFFSSLLSLIFESSL